jgi:uncharacterized protein (TIGR00369 family)
MTEKALDIICAYADASPIAKWLDFSAAEDDGEIKYRLSFAERHLGNPTIRAIHGGVIAAFLEFAAQCEAVAALETADSMRTHNMDIDYISSSRSQDMFGRARITKLGRRVAFVEVTGWQESEERPVARARFRIRVRGAK